MRLTNGVKAAVAGAAIVMAAATPALASVNVGGGTWAYGVGCCSVWSNYKHPSVNHSSSVHGNYWSYSACTSPGSWSLASAEVDSSSVGSSYWDKGCTK